MYKKSQGFSLVEVMIAVVILGVVGSVLINGLLTGRANSEKVSVNAQVFTRLDAAAQVIAATPYLTCSIAGTNPYETLSLPDRVTVERVDGITRAGQWVQCGDATWGNQSTIIQRVIIKAPYTNNADGSAYTGEGAKYIRRTVLKAAPGGNYGANYSVKIASASRYDLSLGPIPGPGGWSPNLTLDSENLAQTCFQVLPSTITSSSRFNPTITNACPEAGSPRATPTVKVNLPAVTAANAASASIKPGTYNIDIGGFNITTGEFASPATLRITVKPTLQVSVSIVNFVSPTSTSGTTCTKFKNTKTSATVAYCLVKLSVVPDTGTGAGIKVMPQDADNCYIKAFSTGTGNTFVRCSFPVFPSQLRQTTWGAGGTVDLYLWRAETALTAANLYCSGGGNNSTYNQANTISLQVVDAGFRDAAYDDYRTTISLPAITVTCT